MCSASAQSMNCRGPTQEAQSQPMDPFFDLAKDLVEARFGIVVEGATRRKGPFVRFARFRIVKNEGLVLRNVGIVSAAKPLRFMSSIGIRPEKRLNVRALQQSAAIVLGPLAPTC